MEKNDKFISARPQKIYTLHTTHAPNFLGLHMNFGAWPVSNYGKNVIIGVIDTGITPNHPSFSDNGMPPPPAKWKGKCELNAVYKACSLNVCGESDILAAMDAAVEDGVDVISASLSRGPARFSDDGVAIAAFAAIRRNGNQTAGYCGPGALNGIDVKGKVVLCVKGGGVSRIGKEQTVKDAGGAAMILANDAVGGYNVIGDTHVIPAAHVSYAAGQKIKAYVNSTSTPTATIVFKGTIIGTKSAPMVASFSSRGPSLATPGILKPDIIGPGVNIIAAWHMSVDNKTNGKTNANFNMASGNSISCPHLSGITALAKNVHPDWSPAAIKSALMTSAYQINLNGSLINDERLLPADVFAIGAGHVNPPKALDPGLVYDITPDDYIAYLCGLGYTEKEIAVITRRTISCHGISIPEAHLNYPSFSIQLGMNISMYSRTVTNVGDAESIYYLKMESVPGVDIVVQPAVLSFTEVNQKMTYRIFFSRSAIRVNVTYVQGSIAWISSTHIVRSPISVKFV
ncbi:hypothetical protein DH2020_005398 [Rehmannia glutinosa]|uniref:Uncharacterized protein n=1 Tax=Rehmannia glutinosa TaxID=99300 RepID=A0ABR0XFY0_REHGL